MKKVFYSILMVVLMSFGIYLELSGYLYHNHLLSMRYSVHGIDISHHQTKINWNLVDRKYKFVLMKATEGKDHFDRNFLYNWNRAQLAGFRVGAYHFFTMLSKGKNQANFYLSKVPFQKNTFPPIIDLEIPTKYPKDKVLKELNDMISILEAHYKKKVIIYVTRHTYKAYIEGEFLNNPIWFRDIKFYPNNSRWEIWQYSNRGRIKGINGFTDRNALKINDIDLFIKKHTIKID